MDWIRAAVSELAKEVRKDAIPLTDAFNLSDYMVNSPLGRHDGNVYESYFDMINKAHKPGAVPSYFPTEIYPLLHKSMEEEDPLEIDDDDE